MAVHVGDRLGEGKSDIILELLIQAVEGHTGERLPSLPLARFLLCRRVRSETYLAITIFLICTSPADSSRAK